MFPDPYSNLVYVIRERHRRERQAKRRAFGPAAERRTDVSLAATVVGAARRCAGAVLIRAGERLQDASATAPAVGAEGADR